MVDKSKYMVSCRNCINETNEIVINNNNFEAVNISKYLCVIPTTDNK